MSYGERYAMGMHMKCHANSTLNRAKRTTDAYGPSIGAEGALIAARAEGLELKTSRAAKSGYKWVEIVKPSGKRLRCCVATFIDGDGKRHIDYYETVEEAALAVARSQRIHGSAKCGGDHHGKGKPAGRNSHTEMRIGFVGKKVRAPNK
jgi:hypothetical protein